MNSRSDGLHHVKNGSMIIGSDRYLVGRESPHEELVFSQPFCPSVRIGGMPDGCLLNELMRQSTSSSRWKTVYNLNKYISRYQ